MRVKIPLSNEFGKIQALRLPGGMSGLTITHHECTATISLYGGQVLTWQPKDQQPVFWLSENAQYIEGKAIRGGVPLCWPWFGPYDHQSGLINAALGEGYRPNSHGFARQSHWQLAEVELSSAAVKIILTYTGEHQHPLFKNAFTLKQELVFGRHFEQTLHITNLSDEVLEYTGALHSYFRVSAPEHVSIDGLSLANFHDKLTDKSLPPEPLANCLGPIDRVYDCNNIIRLVDYHWHRQIEVSSTHCAQWVLWNPGQEVASKMDDVHPHGEQQFVCLEAANTSWQKIQPQQTVAMKQAVRIL